MEIGGLDTGPRDYGNSGANTALHLTAPGRARARAPRARCCRDARMPQVSGKTLESTMNQQDNGRRA
jgi:hypothetical protein